jgi:hypothetical protein
MGIDWKDICLLSAEMGIDWEKSVSSFCRDGYRLEEICFSFSSRWVLTGRHLYLLFAEMGIDWEISVSFLPIRISGPDLVGPGIVRFRSSATIMTISNHTPNRFGWHFSCRIQVLDHNHGHFGDDEAIEDPAVGNCGLV